jgi:hypothetical protein
MLGVVKTGEAAGQGVSAKREIKRPGNIPLKISSFALLFGP